MIRITPLNQGLITSTLTFLLLIPPAPAQTVKLRNIQSDVRFYSERVANKWEILEQEGNLQPGEWIGSGGNSQVELWLAPSGIGKGAGYRQGSSTFTQYETRSGGCQYNLAEGKIVFMAKYSDSRLQYCKRVVTPTAEIELPAPYPEISINPKVVSRYQDTPIILTSGEKDKVVALFVIHDDQETTIGALTGSLEDELITVTSVGKGESVKLKAGELVSLNQGGEIIERSQFNLRKFYRKNKLTIGLGPDQRDIDYIQQETDEDIKQILEAVRDKTSEAVENQVSSQELLGIPEIEDILLDEELLYDDK
ncbi:MAG: hypothetical protein MGF17_01070 [Trichodesmium sp. MAG_R04]|nr:hypothetical protein [Trichodesmium sp. MAG_R04]